MIDACEAFGVKRLMYTSSVHALPDYKDGRIIREEEDFHSTDLFGAYAQTKFPLDIAFMGGLEPLLIGGRAQMGLEMVKLDGSPLPGKKR